MIVRKIHVEDGDELPCAKDNVLHTEVHSRAGSLTVWYAEAGVTYRD